MSLVYAVGINDPNTPCVLQQGAFGPRINKFLNLGLNRYASNPFVKRGGNYNNGGNAGVFNSNIANGNANNNNGFRPVVVV